MNTIKKISLSVLFVLAVNAVDAQQDKTVVDGVIAVVGENMIKYSELETNYLQMLSSGDNTVTRCEVLESMLLNKLMLHQAKVDSLTVSDAEVENELNSRVAYMMQYYGSQEKMERQMNKSLAQIKETGCGLLCNYSRRFACNDSYTVCIFTNSYHSYGKRAGKTRVEKQTQRVQGQNIKRNQVFSHSIHVFGRPSFGKKRRRVRFLSTGYDGCGV